CRGDRAHDDASRARLWQPASDRVARSDVPGHEHWHLRHDPIGESVRRCEMGHVLDSIDDRARVFDLGATVGAIATVGLQGCNPEAHLVIEEEIDLVWKQVPVVHGVSGGTYGAV